MATTTQHILILGLGNILLSDEGLGVAAVRRLIDAGRLPAGVEALDGGTLGLDLLPRLEGVTDLFIVDAVNAGAAPGEIVRLEGDAIPAALAGKMSMHQVGLQDLLALASLRGTLPPRVVLWGMQPGSLAWGTELTPAVAAQLDALVDAVAEEVAAVTRAT